MALSTHFTNALRDTQRAMVDLERMLGAVPGTLMPSFLNHAGTRYPTTDILETKYCYELQAEVPGFDKKDIQIEVPDSHTVVLKGTMQQEHKMESPPASSDTQAAEGTSDTQQITATVANKEKQVGQAPQGHQWWVQERVSGSFFRSFQLPIDIDPQTIKASCANGVLKVTIPKTEGKKSALINID
ncbi:hypothetical protein PS15m_009600 [Mucor circinelloides]